MFSLDDVTCMKGRFPPDLLIFTAGFFLVAVIAVGVGSAIYRATGWSRDSMISAVLGFSVVILVTLRSFWKRRRRPSRIANAHDESKRTI